MVGSIINFSSNANFSLAINEFLMFLRHKARKTSNHNNETRERTESDEKN